MMQLPSDGDEAKLSSRWASHLDDSLFQHEMLEKNYSPAIVQTIQIIHNEYSNTNISLKTLAAQVYLAPTYLAGLFKHETGKSIGEYITLVRVAKAKTLLQDKMLWVYQVAKMVGYTDAKYFMKTFKKSTGFTSSEYRKVIKIPRP